MTCHRCIQDAYDTRMKHVRRIGQHGGYLQFPLSYMRNIVWKSRHDKSRVPSGGSCEKVTLFSPPVVRDQKEGEAPSPSRFVIPFRNRNRCGSSKDGIPLSGAGGSPRDTGHRSMVESRGVDVVPLRATGKCAIMVACKRKLELVGYEVFSNLEE